MKRFTFLLVFADGSTLTEQMLASSQDMAAAMSEQMLTLYSAISVTAEVAS